MSKKLITLLAALLCAFAFAQQNRDLATVGGLPTGMGITYSTIDSGTTSRITQQGLKILETEGTLQRYWVQMTGQGPNDAPTKRIDWNKEKAVIIHLGQRPSGGYSVAVQSIKRIDAWNAKVTVVETTPREGEMVTQALTSPWVLIKVSRTAADLSLSVVKKKPGNWFGGVQVIPGRDWGYPDDRCWWELDGGPSCRIRDAGYWFLDSLQAYQAYWTRSTGLPGNTAPMTGVDFSKHRILAMHLGTRPSGGYKLIVGDVVPDKQGRAKVRLTEQKPRGGLVSALPTSPWVIIRVDKSVLDVDFDFVTDDK